MTSQGADNSGAYQLLLGLEQTRRMAVGRLGLVKFPKGYYVYTGRAKKGLLARVARHRKKEKKRRWHIDYLLRYAGIKQIMIYKDRWQEECNINNSLITERNGEILVPGFGSSDCSCRSHLVYFKKRLGLWKG